MIETFKESNGFSEKLVSELGQTGKTLRFIDIHQGDESFASTEEEEEVDNLINQHLQRGELEPALRYYKDYVQVLAESYQQREKHVADQLHEIIPENSEQVYTVLQGAMHTQTHHQYKKASTPGVKVKMKMETPIFRYSHLTNQLVRRLNYFPEREITEDEYQKAFIGDRIVRQGANLILKDDLNRSEAVDNIIANLDQAEIDQILSRFGRIHLNVMKRMQEKIPRSEFNTEKTLQKVFDQASRVVTRLMLDQRNQREKVAQ